MTPVRTDTELTVWRHSGRGDFDIWRHVPTRDPKAKYEALAASLRQGCVELRDAKGITIFARTQAPRLRTRW